MTSTDRWEQISFFPSSSLDFTIPFIPLSHAFSTVTSTFWLPTASGYGVPADSLARQEDTEENMESKGQIYILGMGYLRHVSEHLGTFWISLESKNLVWSISCDN